MATNQITLQLEEFQALQNQLNDLKTQLYESKAKETKLQKLGLQWKQKAKALDEEFTRAKGIIAASKDAKEVARLHKELEVARASGGPAAAPSSELPAASPQIASNDDSSVLDDSRALRAEQERDEARAALEASSRREEALCAELAALKQQPAVAGSDDTLLQRQVAELTAGYHALRAELEAAQRASGDAVESLKVTQRALDEARANAESTKSELDVTRIALQEARNMTVRADTVSSESDHEELSRLRQELASVIAASKATAAELAQTQQQLAEAPHHVNGKSDAVPAGQPEELNRLREELASVIAKSKMTAAELAQTQQQLVDARQAATDLDGRLKLSEAAQVELGAALQQALVAKSEDVDGAATLAAQLSQSQTSAEELRALLADARKSQTQLSVQLEKVQVDAAARALGLEQELAAAQADVAKLRPLADSVPELRSNEGRLRKALDQLQTIKAEAIARADRAESDRADVMRLLERAKADVAKRTDQLEAERASAAKTQQQLRAMEVEKQALAQTLAQTSAQLDVIKKRDAESTASAAKFKAELATSKDTSKRLQTSLAKAEEQVAALQAILAAMEKDAGVAMQRTAEFQALAERRALEVDKLSDQLRFASDDKQNLLAEKKKQYEKLDTERAEQVASLEAKMTELAARLKTKHTQWTEAAAERDRLAAAVEERNATSSKLQAECEALGAERAALTARVEQLVLHTTDLSAQLAVVQAAQSETSAARDKRIQELEQALVDAGLERKVSEKKSVQLVRDLQAQLSKLQAVASSPKPSRLGSRSPRASTATNDADGPVPVDLKLLQEENNALIHRISTMQESQWRLEERIKDVEALNRQLCEDLAKKQTILRDYMLTIKAGRRGMDRETHRKPSASEAGPDVVQKLEEVLEETLLKNIQLKQDLETLGDDVEALRKQNEDLKKTIGRQRAQ